MHQTQYKTEKIHPTYGQRLGTASTKRSVFKPGHKLFLTFVIKCDSCDLGQANNSGVTFWTERCGVLVSSVRQRYSNDLRRTGVREVRLLEAPRALEADPGRHSVLEPEAGDGEARGVPGARVVPLILGHHLMTR